MPFTEGFKYSKDEANKLYEGIFTGVIDLSSLPRKLYYETAKVLTKGLYKGWGKTITQIQFGTSDFKLLNELRQNIYIFSGAKTATQVMDIKSLMYDKDKIRTLSEFKKVAQEKFTDYNTGKLESEFITAKTTASSAINYKDALQHDQYVSLTAHVIVDDKTAPECLRMNGVTAPANDPVWIHNLAARHFRCRCFETKNSKYDDAKNTPKGEIKKIMAENEKDMGELFKFNPVKDKIIFSDKHPYYDIGKRNSALAKRTLTYLFQMRSNAKAVIARLKAKLDKVVEEAPRELANTGVKMFIDNFKTQSFEGKKWQDRKDKSNGRPILIGKTRELRNATVNSVRTANKKRIVWGNYLPYASVHNNGETINVPEHKTTVNLREHSTNYLSGVVSYRFASKKGRKYLRATSSSTHTVPAHSIKMPQRKFMGNSFKFATALRKKYEKMLSTVK